MYFFYLSDYWLSPLLHLVSRRENDWGAAGRKLRLFMFSLQHTIRNFWGLFHHQRFAVRDPDNTAAVFFFCQANLSYQERERERMREIIIV